MNNKRFSKVMEIFNVLLHHHLYIGFSESNFIFSSETAIDSDRIVTSTD